MNKQTNEQTVAEAAAVYDMYELMESYISEAESIYTQYERMYDELGADHPSVDKLYDQWRYARQRAEDIYDSLNE